MKITAIKAQVKNPGRVSIYVDGAYSFSLTPNQLLEQKVFVGLELDAPMLETLKKASDFGKLYNRLLRYALLRPHSCREVADYCRRKQFDQEACAEVIELLSARKYIDDAAFARAWVESRQLTKATSQRNLQLELKRKGISDEMIAQALAAQNYDETAALQKLITKKRRQARYQDRQKLLQYLVRQGFSYGEVMAVLADV